MTAKGVLIICPKVQIARIEVRMHTTTWDKASLRSRLSRILGVNNLGAGKIEVDLWSAANLDLRWFRTRTRGSNSFGAERAPHNNLRRTWGCGAQPPNKPGSFTRLRA
jgi:hypothetical protein